MSSSKDLAATLGDVDLFRGLSHRVLTRIAESGHEAHYAEGATVILQGDSVTGFKAFSPAGVEMHVVLTHRSKARHAAAARLFANFMMTPEGNKIFNSEPGSISVFDTASLPKQYVSPKRDAIARKDLIAKLLGFQ